VLKKQNRPLSQIIQLCYNSLLHFAVEPELQRRQTN